MMHASSQSQTANLSKRPSTQVQKPSSSGRVHGNSDATLKQQQQ